MSMWTTWVVTRRRYRDSTAFLQQGKLPQTSQINVAAYAEFFEQQLQKGDLLHIAFTSGHVRLGEQRLHARRRCCGRSIRSARFEVIDSLCSSSGYGLLVDEAADLRDAGEIPGGGGPVGAGEPATGCTISFSPPT